MGIVHRENTIIGVITKRHYGLLSSELSVWSLDNIITQVAQDTSKPEEWRKHDRNNIFLSFENFKTPSRAWVLTQSHLAVFKSADYI